MKQKLNGFVLNDQISCFIYRNRYTHRAQLLITCIFCRSILELVSMDRLLLFYCVLTMSLLYDIMRAWYTISILILYTAINPNKLIFIFFWWNFIIKFVANVKSLVIIILHFYFSCEKKNIKSEVVLYRRDKSESFTRIWILKLVKEYKKLRSNIL